MGKKSENKTDRLADFWDFLSPIFVKELRQGLRANQFVWPFIVVQIAALICISIEYAALTYPQGNQSVLQPGAPNCYFIFFCGAFFP